MYNVCTCVLIIIVLFIVEKTVTKVLKLYFDKYGKFSSEGDMQRLEQMLTRVV